MATAAATAGITIADLIKAVELVPPGADAPTFRHKNMATHVTLAEDGGMKCMAHGQSARIGSRCCGCMLNCASTPGASRGVHPATDSAAWGTSDDASPRRPGDTRPCEAAAAGGPAARPPARCPAASPRPHGQQR